MFLEAWKTALLGGISVYSHFAGLAAKWSFNEARGATAHAAAPKDQFIDSLLSKMTVSDLGMARPRCPQHNQSRSQSG